MLVLACDQSLMCQSEPCWMRAPQRYDLLGNNSKDMVFFCQQDRRFAEIFKKGEVVAICGARANPSCSRAFFGLLNIFPVLSEIVGG